jgi:hypothetical protein
MKTELHLHSSRYSACAINTPEEMLTRCDELGYECIFLTEHDQLWSDAELERLRCNFPQLLILPGIEKTLGDHHLLVLGADDAEYLKLEQPIDILAKARAMDHLTVLAHPYRFEGGAEMLGLGLRPDALELRSNNHEPDNAARSERTARELGLFGVNSGDSHSLEMLGRFWIDTDETFSDAAELRRIIRGGAYRNCHNIVEEEASPCYRWR